MMRARWIQLAGAWRAAASFRSRRSSAGSVGGRACRSAGMASPRCRYGHDHGTPNVTLIPDLRNAALEGFPDLGRRIPCGQRDGSEHEFDYTSRSGIDCERHLLGRDRRYADSTPGSHGSALSLTGPVAEVGSAGAHGACSLEPPPRVAWLGWARRQYRQA